MTHLFEIALVIFTLSIVADWWSTMQAFKKNSRAREANPFTNWFIEKWGVFKGLAIKTILFDVGVFRLLIIATDVWVGRTWAVVGLFVVSLGQFYAAWNNRKVARNG